MASNEMKIVSIIPYRIFPARLGGEKGIAVFNEYLAKRVRLMAVTVKSNDPVYAKGYRLLNTMANNRLRYANLLLFFRFRRLLRRVQATHLITEHPYFGWLAFLLRAATGVRWIVHSHNIEYMRSKSIGRSWWKALRRYEGWVYRKADRVFFISEDDRAHAIRDLGVKAEKSLEVTYGIEQAALPADRMECRQKVSELHGIADNEKILLFNGALYHSTNYDALTIILEKINPLLLQASGFAYKILICGKGLPASFRDLEIYKNKNVVYAGFVDDVSMYFKAADVFLNPILSGGGVKTKAIEAISLNCTVVSTPLGAMGINREASGRKLRIVPDEKWAAFAAEVIASAADDSDTPDSFFDYYYWGNIIDKVVASLQHA